MDRMTETQHETMRAIENGRDAIARLMQSRGGKGFQPVPDGVRHLASAIHDPAKFWGAAAAGSLGGGEVADGRTAAELSAAAIRAAAAKLAIGDYSPVRESLIGMSAWLSAEAVRLANLTEQVSGQKAEEKRAELIRLSLKATDQAAKTLAAAAALNAIDTGKGVTIDN